MPTQFSKGNIVQNTQDSSFDGFVIGVTGLYLIQQCRPFPQQRMFLTIENGD
jgi:hypothetical protein